MNDRFLAIIFVILASLAAIHIMGRRFQRGAEAPTSKSRPPAATPLESSARPWS